MNFVMNYQEHKRLGKTSFVLTKSSAYDKFFKK
jgi:hypothetical protein